MCNIIFFAREYENLLLTLLLTLHPYISAALAALVMDPPRSRSRSPSRPRKKEPNLPWPVRQRPIVAASKATMTARVPLPKLKGGTPDVRAKEVTADPDIFLYAEHAADMDGPGPGGRKCVDHRAALHVFPKLGQV